MMCSSPTGSPTSGPGREGKFDLDDYVDYLIGFSGIDPVRICCGMPTRVPPLPRGADERGPGSGDPKKPDDDGRTDRSAQSADRGQYIGDRAFARLVPAQCDRHRPEIIRQRAEGVSGFRSLPVS